VVLRHLVDDPAQRTESKRPMARHRHVMLAIHLGRQAHVAARLPGFHVSKLRERSNEIIAR
jgi:hypothetical protein